MRKVRLTAGLGVRAELWEPEAERSDGNKLLLSSGALTLQRGKSVEYFATPEFFREIPRKLFDTKVPCPEYVTDDFFQRLPRPRFYTD